MILDTSNPDVMGPLMFWIFVIGISITFGLMAYDLKKTEKTLS